MNNSWYRFNTVELVISWAAGSCIWFGCLYYAWLLYDLPVSTEYGSFMSLLLGGLSLLAVIGFSGAMRLHTWGFRLYLVSVVVILFLYSFSTAAQNLSEGVIFWLHTGVVPFHLFLFGLPKNRHLLSYDPSEPDGSAPVYQEEAKPASVLFLGGVIPSGFALFGLVFSNVLIVQ